MHHKPDSQEPEDKPKPCIGPADTEVVPKELQVAHPFCPFSSSYSFLVLQEHLYQHLSCCQPEKTVCEAQCYVF